MPALGATITIQVTSIPLCLGCRFKVPVGKFISFIHGLFDRFVHISRVKRTGQTMQLSKCSGLDSNQSRINAKVMNSLAY